MFKRIARIVLVGITTFYTLPVQASPIGFYWKPHGMIYWGDKISSKENSASSLLSGAYQFNRFRIIEFAHIIPLGAPDNDVKNALTFTNKDVIPLKYYLNFYTQWGASWKNKLGIHAPFGGAGIAYYHTRAIHFDIAWRHYGLFRYLRDKGSSNFRQNSIVVAVGYHIKS